MYCLQCTVYNVPSIAGLHQHHRIPQARRGEARRLRSQRVQMHDLREGMCREKKEEQGMRVRKKRFRHLALTAGEEAGRVMAFGLGGWGNEGLILCRRD